MSHPIIAAIGLPRDLALIVAGYAVVTARDVMMDMLANGINLEHYETASNCYRIPVTYCMMLHGGVYVTVILATLTSRADQMSDVNWYNGRWWPPSASTRTHVYHLDDVIELLTVTKGANRWEYPNIVGLDTLFNWRNGNHWLSKYGALFNDRAEAPIVLCAQLRALLRAAMAARLVTTDDPLNAILQDE